MNNKINNKILSKFDKNYKSTDPRNSMSPLLSINTKKSTRHNNQIPEKLSKRENLTRSQRKKFSYRETKLRKYVDFLKKLCKTEENTSSKCLKKNMVNLEC